MNWKCRLGFHDYRNISGVKKCIIRSEFSNNTVEQWSVGMCRRCRDKMLIKDQSGGSFQWYLREEENMPTPEELLDSFASTKDFVIKEN